MSNILPIRPRRPMAWNSFDVVSLYEMLEFHAEDFCRSMSLIGQFHEQYRNGIIHSNSAISSIMSELAHLLRTCETLGLNTTVAQLERLKKMVMDGEAFRPGMWPYFVNSVMEAGTRLTDELDARKCYIVNAERNSFLTGNHFAPIVAERFSDVIPDMDEAARCFAFERPTACIFHLMRTTEFGLKQIAALLEIKDHAPNWDPIIRKIDDELKTDYRDRKYKGSQDLLANMSTHLHAVKVAWRNKTMHIEKINTMEHAKEIYDATSGLMRYLAENLPAKKAGVIQSIKGKFGA